MEFVTSVLPGITVKSAIGGLQRRKCFNRIRTKEKASEVINCTALTELADIKNSLLR